MSDENKPIIQKPGEWGWLANQVVGAECFPSNHPMDKWLAAERQVELLTKQLTHYESALKEAKYSLDACHAHTVHGEVITREECHLCKTLATINKVLETK